MKLLRLGLVVTSSIFILTSCQLWGPKEPTHMHGNHDGTQVDASGNRGTWPPQPSNISKTGVLVGNFAPQSLEGLQTAEIEEAVLSSPAVVAALGSDYTLLDVNIASDKGGNQRPEAMLFSYSNNVTVHAWLTGDNQVRHELIAPQDYQFPEGKEDIDRSIRLARQALVDQGFSKAMTLGAHSMLTFPKRDAEHSFHDVRMMYANFGPGDGTEPLYAAWVDLTNNVVVESGLIASYLEGQ